MFPAGFENDDELRSEFVRRLTTGQNVRARRPAPGETEDKSGPIPRTLVRFWHDEGNIPPDVRACLDSWGSLQDDGFSLRTFDSQSAATYIAERFGSAESAAFARCRHPAMMSDYFRMCFVLAEGGLYVDADDVLVGSGWRAMFHDDALKLQALCYDTTAGGMVPVTGIHTTNPEPGRIYYINNNPIAAPAGHPVVRRALARATGVLIGDDQDPEIQSTTGPGNLTVVLAAHAHESQRRQSSLDFELLLDWEETAEPRWDLAYRRDRRNWRNVYPC